MSEESNEARVFVVDDDDGVRDALTSLFQARRTPHEAYASAEAFLEARQGAARGCVLLDYRMPGLSGLDALKEIAAWAAPPPVIMLTAHGDVALAVAAMRAGACDFLEKPWEKDALFAAVDRALELDREQAEAESEREDAQARLAALTPRETEVMRELITGAANKVVARRLDLSPRTVEFHRARVFEKTECQSVAELVRLAFAAGLES